MCPKGYFQSMKGQEMCNPCRAGRFQDEEGRKNCKVCERNTFSYSGSERCQDCESGTTSPPGSRVCNICPAGSAVIEENCELCKEGSYSNKEGQTGCSLCPKGFSQSLRGQETCVICMAGKYQDKIGQTKCKVCLKNTFSNSGSQACEHCESGTTSPPDSSECDICPAGSAVIDGICALCPAGSYAHFNKQTVCEMCPKNTFAPIDGSTGCKFCIFGSNSPAGSTSCKICPAGSAVNQQGICLECPLGTFTDLVSQKQCETCPNNTFSGISGSTKCTPCPSGSTSSPGSSICTICPSGSAVVKGRCALCKVGNFTDEGGQITCKMCPINTFCDLEGCAECEPCSSGSTSAQGSSSCEACPAGSAVNDGMCLKCAAGTYSDRQGLTKCKDCLPGSFNNNPGALECPLCAVKYYMPDYRATECIFCEDTLEKKTGQSSCNPCEKGTRPNYKDDLCVPYNIAKEKDAKNPWNKDNASLADDGNTETCYTTALRDELVYIDLGDKFRVKEIIVNMDYRGDYQVENAEFTISLKNAETFDICGTFTSHEVIDKSRHIICNNTQNLYNHVIIQSRNYKAKVYVSLCEIKVYTVELQVPCPANTTSPTGFRPCSKYCPRGSILTANSGEFRCGYCPIGHTTYRSSPTECYGPELELVYRDRVEIIRNPDPIIEPLKYYSSRESFRSVLGTWTLWFDDHFTGHSITRPKPMSVLSELSDCDVTCSYNLKSVQPVIKGLFCYELDVEQQETNYRGTRNISKSSKSCLKWNALAVQTCPFHDANDCMAFIDTISTSEYDHNYCRDFTGEDKGGPWCYITDTDGAIKSESCDIPACKLKVTRRWGKIVTIRGCLSVSVVLTNYGPFYVLKLAECDDPGVLGRKGNQWKFDGNKIINKAKQNLCIADRLFPGDYIPLVDCNVIRESDSWRLFWEDDNQFAIRSEYVYRYMAYRGGHGSLMYLTPYKSTANIFTFRLNDDDTCHYTLVENAEFDLSTGIEPNMATLNSAKEKCNAMGYLCNFITQKTGSYHYTRNSFSLHTSTVGPKHAESKKGSYWKKKQCSAELYGEIEQEYLSV